jgi:tetraacyldisaccharide 4'-kinase
MLAKAMQLLTVPLSMVYSGVVRARAALYRHRIFTRNKLNGTVISVGNLTVGGTGKTPMVLWIAEQLAAQGEHPAILTRGYRGKAQRDSSGIPLADEVALLRERLAGRAQLGVGKDRYANGKVLERHGSRWFILDDGFQHMALDRDAEIVLLDSTDPFGGGWLLPAGRLREPPTALARADVVVITRSRHAPALEMDVRRFASAPIFYARPELESVLRAPALEVALSADPAGLKFFAFCGIGNPGAFLVDLREWGFRVVGQMTFRDHHRYSQADLKSLQQTAGAAGADALICSEKDVFNLRELVCGALPVFACRIRLGLSDAEGFWKAVLAAVERHRQADRI